MLGGEGDCTVWLTCGVRGQGRLLSHTSPRGSREGSGSPAPTSGSCVFPLGPGAATLPSPPGTGPSCPRRRTPADTQRGVNGGYCSHTHQAAWGLTGAGFQSHNRKVGNFWGISGPSGICFLLVNLLSDWLRWRKRRREEAHLDLHQKVPQVLLEGRNVLV